MNPHDRTERCGANGDPPNRREAMPQRLLYTPAAAAELLLVRESWLRRRAAALTIPCTFVGKHLRFSHADLTAIVDAGATTPSSGRALAASAGVVARWAADRPAAGDDHPPATRSVRTGSLRRIERR